MYAAVSAACDIGSAGCRSNHDGEGTYEIVQLDSCDTTVDTRDDLLGNGNRVNVVHVKAVTEPRDTGGDLVELDALLASI